MRAVTSALQYAAKGWPVFPVVSAGPDRKKPHIKNGYLSASTDEAQIHEWWHRWPNALVAAATGKATFVALDIDVKGGLDGFGSLAQLVGYTGLPATRTVHTPSGGRHLHFDPKGQTVHSTQGDKGRGIGAGLDWRGENSSIILPSSGSGYMWDSVNGLDGPILDVPPELLPRPPKPVELHPPKSPNGVSAYGEAALHSACENIMSAPNGIQEATLNGECYSIGRLVGCGEIPDDLARQFLLWAAHKMPSYDLTRVWTHIEVEKKVLAAFAAGVKHPRAKPDTNAHRRMKP